jgi:hypothetical protein
MPIDLTKLQGRVIQMIRDFFTGSITIHMSEGKIMKIEIKEVMRDL